MPPDSQPSVEDALRQIENAYSNGWAVDAENWAKAGLYSTIAEMTDPGDGRIVTDVGTGLGHQLVHLMASNSRGQYIGTERTPNNLLLAEAFIRSKGIPGVAVLESGATLMHRTDGVLSWGNRDMHAIRSQRNDVRQLMETHTLLIDDDIREPQVLTAILGDDKIDAAILSLPGGSMARVYEWPYEVRAIDRRTELERATETTDATRMAFYRFASKTVRDGGKMILAERLAVDPRQNIKMVVDEMHARLGVFAEYWDTLKVSGVSIEHDIDGVPLAAQIGNDNVSRDELQKAGHRAYAVMLSLKRKALAVKDGL